MYQLPESDYRQSNDEPFLEVSHSTIELIEKHLSSNDLIALMFLICDDISLYSELVEKGTPPPISKWVSCKAQNIPKLLDSLFVIKNYKVLKLLGVNKYDASYIFNHTKTGVSPVKKALYSICDSFTITNSPESVDNYSRLEMMLMDWIVKKKITVEEPYNIEAFIDYLDCHGNGKLAIKLNTFMSNHINHIKTKLGTQQMKDERDDIYQIFDSTNVGLCLIINQEKFDNPNYGTRDGSLLDVTTLIKTMLHFNIKYEFINSFNGNELEEYIKTTIKQELEPIHSMLFIFIMSHGEEGTVLSYDGQPVSVKQIKTAIHNSKCLNGRPVVLIIQACQGTNYYTPIQSDAVDIGLATELNNILVCMTAVPGFRAWRHKPTGSFYIQTLCDVMRKNENEDMCSIVTRVHQMLSNPNYFREKGFFKNDYNIAMLPEYNSRLGKKLYVKIPQKM